MAHVQALRCRECGREYDVAPIFTCEWCFGPLEVTYDYDAIRASVSRETIAAGPLIIWRYADLLPVERNPAVDLGAGFTPLGAGRPARRPSSGSARCGSRTTPRTRRTRSRIASPRSRSRRRWSSASRSRPARRPATSPTRSRRTPRTPGLRSFVFVPANFEQGKIVTTAVYGGNVVAIDGNYDDVNRLCAELAGTYPWAFVNVNVRTFYAEGSKTLAFETAEQLGWQTPDHVVVPVASGSLLTKIRKGFDELYKVGLLDEEPIGARQRRAGAGVLAGRDGVARRVRHDQAGEARHDREVARDRESGRRLLRARRGAPDRWRLLGRDRR